MSDTDLSGRIRQRREQLGLSQEELAARMGYRSKSSITKLEKGINDLPRAKLEELAAALNTTPAWLMGLMDLPSPPPGFEPLPEMVRVPLVGSIACGTPITAEQNIECYIGVPAAWHAAMAAAWPPPSATATSSASAVSPRWSRGRSPQSASVKKPPSSTFTGRARP